MADQPRMAIRGCLLGMRRKRGCEFGLEGMTKAMAVGLADKTVRVNTVACVTSGMRLTRSLRAVLTANRSSAGG